MPLAEVPGCVGLNVRVERKRLVNELRRRARPSKGDAQAYLGSPVPVLGVSVPDLRELNSAFSSIHGWTKPPDGGCAIGSGSVP